MKSTGIIRKIDALGRIVIPIELRRILQVDTGDDLEIFTETDAIVLKKFTPHCYLCGNPSNLTDFDNKRICTDCIKRIKEL